MKHYLFDVEMFNHIGITDAISFTTGETLTGGTSGATAIIESISSATSVNAISSSTEMQILLLLQQLAIQILKMVTQLKLQVLHKQN